MTRSMRAITMLVLIVAAVGLAACGDSEDSGSGATTTTPAATTTSPATTTQTTQATETTPPAGTTIVVKGEQPEGGVAVIKVDKGETVTFTVQSDTAQEIHVHGYDITKNVPANGTVTFSFPAKIDGSFEVELEDPGVQIANLQVFP